MDVKTIKTAAQGRWPEILEHVGGFDADILDGRAHACPKCGGTDRFRLIDPDDGAVYCNKCFKKKSGDGLAALMWLTGDTFPQAIRRVARHLDVSVSNGNGQAAKENLIEKVARLKHVSKKALVAYGAQEAMRGKLKVVRFPTYDEMGMECSHFDVPLDKGVKGWNKAKVKAGLFLPAGRVPKPGETWIIVEGVKDAGALHSMDLLAVGLPTSEMYAKFARLFKDVNVVIVPDRDQAGEDGADVTASRLFGLAESVRVVTLPTEFKTTKGDDVRDILKRRDGKAELKQAIDDASDWKPELTSRPSIVLDVDEDRVIDEAIAALANHKEIYQQGGRLVHVVRSAETPPGIKRDDDVPRIVQLPQPRLRELMAATAEWLRLNADHEEMPCHPPDWAVKGVDSRGQWSGIPRIEAVTETPVLRADGSVLQTPGYDPMTGILYSPRCRFPEIPERPTKVEIEEAKNALLEVISDFPLENDKERKSAWMAAVLSPLARYAYAGSTPLFLADGNVAGTGKGLLLDAAVIIGTGRGFARMSNPRNDDEARKRITSIALAGYRTVLLDNVSGSLGSSSLDAALTSTSWDDRVLCKSEMTGPVPLYAIWYATGNNVELIGDTPRRVVHIRLNTKVERPEERTGFKHPNLLAWVHQERPRLTAAALTILRGFSDSGKRKNDLKAWGSFDGWSDLVRQAIVSTGMEDPAKTRLKLLQQSDRDSSTLRQLIAGWQELDPSSEGLTVRQVLNKLAEEGKEKEFQGLREAFDNMGSRGKQPTTSGIGKRLQHFRQRVVNGFYLDSKSGSGHVLLWSVRSAKCEGGRGDKGNESTPEREESKTNNDIYIATLGNTPPTPASPLRSWDEGFQPPPDYPI